MNTGKTIKNARMKKGLKQKELAELMQVAPQVVSQWENNLRRPKIEAIRKLSAILDVSTDELLDVQPSPDNAQENAGDYMAQAVAALEKMLEQSRRISEGLKNSPAYSSLPSLPFMTQAAVTAQSAEDLAEEITEKANALNVDGRLRVLAFLDDLGRIPEYRIAQ